MILVTHSHRMFDPNRWVLLTYVDVFKTPNGMNNQEVVAILYANQSYLHNISLSNNSEASDYCFSVVLRGHEFLCIPSIAFSCSRLSFPRKPVRRQAAYFEETLSYRGLFSCSFRAVCGLTQIYLWLLLITSTLDIRSELPFLDLVSVSPVACSFGVECWVWMTPVSLYSVSSCNRMNITVGWTSCGGTSSRGSVKRSKPWRTSTGFCWRTFYLLMLPNIFWDATGKMRWIEVKVLSCDAFLSFLVYMCIWNKRVDILGKTFITMSVVWLYLSLA